MNLALFDFDGTLTWADSFTRFLLFATPRARLARSTLALAPMIAGHLGGVIPAPRLRAAMVRRGLLGRRVDEVEQQGSEFARTVLPRLLRPRALERIRWHQARGDRVVVVSASLDVYLEPFVEPLGIELICSKLERQQGRFTGRYAGEDCTGPQKARRVREAHDLNVHPVVYAYGNTAEDAELLAMAHQRFFRWSGFD